MCVAATCSIYTVLLATHKQQHCQLNVCLCVWIEGYCVCGRGRGWGRGSAWKRDQWACHVAQSIDEFEVLKGVGDAGGWGAEWACRGASRVTGQPLNVAITHRQGLQPAHTHTHTHTRSRYIYLLSLYMPRLYIDIHQGLLRLRPQCNAFVCHCAIKL